MGVPWEYCEDVGTLIGLKTVVNELIAYKRMGELKKQGRIFGRSEAIATFAICGFANPGSIGIQIGVFSSLAPEKKEQVTNVIVRAFVTGSAVCFLTASIAGKEIPIETPIYDYYVSSSQLHRTLHYRITFFHFVSGVLIDEASSSFTNNTISNITSMTLTSWNAI